MAKESLESKNRPFVTSGRRIWWIPDPYTRINGFHPAPEAILYRDDLRGGVWVPEEEISPEWREKLTSDAGER